MNLMRVGSSNVESGARLTVLGSAASARPTASTSSFHSIMTSSQSNAAAGKGFYRKPGHRQKGDDGSQKAERRSVSRR